MDETAAVKKLLRENRIVQIMQRLDQKLADQVITEIVTLVSLDQKSPIQLAINSVGGDLLAGMQIYDFIRVLPCKVIGINFGKCHSTASLVMQACESRLSTRHARMLIHSMETNAEYTVNDAVNDWMQETVRGSLNLYEEVIEIYAKRTRIKKKKLRQLMHDGERLNKRLTAPMAKELGFIDDIIDNYPFFQLMVPNLHPESVKTLISN